MRSYILVGLGLTGALVFGCEATASRNPLGSQSGSGVGGQGGGDGGAGGMAGAASSSSGGGGMGGTGPCKMDVDCANDPTGSYCEVGTGRCVECLAGSNTCGLGKYCDPTTKECANGCLTNVECGGISPICDTSTHTCVECLKDLDCPQGSICGSHSCFPGCSGQQPCVPGFSCCTSNCYDLSTDVFNCGGCNNPCPAYPNAAGACVDSACQMGACKPNFVDCDESPTNGCEWNVLQDGPCTCAPGATRPCYQGAAGTQNVGPCKGGTQTCDATGTTWSACIGQVLPKTEICANGIDEDCNGEPDQMDADGDGFSPCAGDCCDSVADGCPSPLLVNPGAFEVVGNGVNDDCNSGSSDTVAPADCSTAAKFTGLTPMDLARAMDLCQTTTLNPLPLLKKWGILTAEFMNPNGTAPTPGQLAAMQNRQTAVLLDYGTGGIVPKKGPTMAGLSTGLMRDKNDPNVPNVPNTDNSLASTPPSVYLSAHGNVLPSSAGCNGGNCEAGSGANDATNVRLSVRTPTNALSFSYQFKFITYEYWMYACTKYNDFYLALLQSNAAGIPADKNISFDAVKNPVSVNNGFFDVCVARACYTCPAGYGELQGTGMDYLNNGGATKWLTTETPIIPGEVIRLEFMIFDVSDNLLDSVVLLDNFQWGLNPAIVNTHD